jgi:hypothetical protein
VVHLGLAITMREERRRGSRKSHNEELRNLYSSPDIISVIERRWMRWAEHVARMEDIRNT